MKVYTAKHTAGISLHEASIDVNKPAEDLTG